MGIQTRALRGRRHTRPLYESGNFFLFNGVMRALPFSRTDPMASTPLEHRLALLDERLGRLTVVGGLAAVDVMRGLQVALCRA